MALNNYYWLVGWFMNSTEPVENKQSVPHYPLLGSASGGAPVPHVVAMPPYMYVVAYVVTYGRRVIFEIWLRVVASVVCQVRSVFLATSSQNIFSSGNKYLAEKYVSKDITVHC